MTATVASSSSSSPRTGRGRGLWIWLGLGALVVVVGLAAGGPPDDGTPLAPDSTGPLGAKALVLLLEDLGADVTVSSDTPDGDVDVTLLLSDDLTDEQRTDLEDWLADGGRAVVADPISPLTPPIAAESTALGGLFESTLEPGDCTIDALDDLDRVDPSGGVLFDVPEGAGRCFTDEEAAFVVASAAGSGTTVAVGGAAAFTNATLGEEDNAVLAGTLLAPVPGTRVQFLEPRRAGSGDETLVDLIAPNVAQAIWQLAFAFLLYALWRARRLGKPIVEPQPVQIAGSELVVAVGELLQQTRSPQRAAEILRQDLRRTLADRLGLPPDATPQVVAAVTARRTGVDAEQLHDVLAGAPVTSEADLVSLATLIDAIRKEVLHGRTT